MATTNKPPRLTKEQKERIYFAKNNPEWSVTADTNGVPDKLVKVLGLLDEANAIRVTLDYWPADDKWTLTCPDLNFLHHELINIKHTQQAATVAIYLCCVKLKRLTEAFKPLPIIRKFKNYKI